MKFSIHKGKVANCIRNNSNKVKKLYKLWNMQTGVYFSAEFY